MSAAAQMPGWFGKLPNLGDFASRRLPASFVQPWDRWLQSGMVAARAALGESRWLDTYLVAPVLRFWLAPGVLGAGSWAGLMMPSTDRVGRYFPLTIAQPDGTLASTLASREWFRALDHAARQVLDVTFTVDDFEQALAGLPPDAHAAAAESAAASLAMRLDGELAADRHNNVWWCGDAEEGAAFRCFAGLPPEGAFAALLGAAA
jgi:type VI secretion system protein ImpM